MARIFCEETYLKEIEPGLVEYKIPEDTGYGGYLMVFNEKGGSTSMGASPVPGVLGRTRTDSFLKKSWGHCQIVYYKGNNEYYSEKILIGHNKPADKSTADRHKVAIKYEEIITYCRQRVHVHDKMRQDAILHLRPAGEKAHNKAMTEFNEIRVKVMDALRRSEPLDLATIYEEVEMARKTEYWANGQDGVNPPPPIQMWYRNIDGQVFLKAQDQHGFDRRPHELVMESGHCLFHMYGQATPHRCVGFCIGKEWNEVARGYQSWRPMRDLNVEMLELTARGKMLYIKTGEKKYEQCSFLVPALTKTPAETPQEEKDYSEIVAKVRKWKHSPRWAGSYHRHRWNRTLILLGETEDVKDDNGTTPVPMTIGEIEELAAKPWGHRWKETLKALK